MRERSKANGHSSQGASAANHVLFQDKRPHRPSGIHAINQQIAAETVSGAVRRGQRALLFRMLDALSAETDLSNFLGRVVIAVAEQFAAHSAYLCLHCEDQNVLRLEGWYVREDLAPVRDPKAFATQLPRTAPAGPLWQKLLRIPKPILVPNAVKDPRVPFRDLLSADGLKSLLLVPLVSGKKPLGLIGIMSPGSESYEPEKIELAQGLAQQTVAALQLARLAENARQAALLQERSRMARDIHDTLAQGFAGIMIQMNLAENIVFQDQPEAVRHIARARELARGCQAEARRLVFALQPRLLKKHCLAAALQQLAAELTSDTEVRLEFALQGETPVLTPEMEAELLHIGQEALTNVVKHARSTKVRIELTSDPQWIRLSIQDDGSGFDPFATTPTQRFGLAGMRERSRQIGGKLEIRSEPGCGTQIQVVVPCAGNGHRC
ncbi:MAG TPA: GAF domain-containing sensor histidine kinase [Candidatus Angelobacter sp.]|nr:GAF domain-containing sensor histidine kinase [Candidatus Angelobacter sp.]